MKQAHMLFIAAVTTSICMESSCLEQTDDTRCQNCLLQMHQQQQNDQKQKEVIVSNFLAGFATLLNLISGPKDPQAFAQGSLQAAQIVGNVVLGKPAQAVVIAARKCIENGGMSMQELLTYVEDECTKAEVDAQVTHELTRAISETYQEYHEYAQ